MLLHDFRKDGNSRVDRIRNNTDNSLGGEFGSSNGQVLDDSRIDIEQIVSGHTLPQVSQGPQEDKLLTGLRGTPAGMTIMSAFSTAPCNSAAPQYPLVYTMNRPFHSINMAYSSRSVDMRQISSDTGRVNDIVQAQLRNRGVRLQEQGKRLANTTSST